MRFVYKSFLGSVTLGNEKEESYAEKCYSILMNIYLNATKGPFLYTQLKKLIKLFMNVSPRMRIELIFQMIKYTNHPVEEEGIKAWQSIALISNYVNLPKTFMLYFLNFIYNSYMTYQENYVLKNYIAFIFVNFVKNKSLNDRTVIPTVSQLKDILKLKRLIIRVYLTHNKFIETCVEVYETFDELKFKVLRFLNFPDDAMPFMGFYEVNETDQFVDENFIEDFVRVSDVLASWEYNYFATNSSVANAESDNFLSSKNNYSEEKSKVYLRFRYYTQPEESTTLLKEIEDSIALAEIWRLIIVNRILLDKESLYNLIAVYLKMKYPKIGVKYIYALINDIKKALKVFGANSNLNLTATPEKILRRMKDYEGDDVASLKRKLTILVRTNVAYKTQPFMVYFDQDQMLKHDNVSADMIFVIGSDKAFLCKLNMDRVVNFRFDCLKTIHIHGDLVILIYKKLTRVRGDDGEYTQKEEIVQYVFSCNQTVAIYQTIKNNISISINGFFKNNEVKENFLYKDINPITLNEDTVNRIVNRRVAVENVNRFNKKHI